MSSLDFNIGTWIRTLLQLAAWAGLVWVLITAFQYKKDINISGLEVVVMNPENRVHLIEKAQFTQFVLESLDDSIQHYSLSELPLRFLFNQLNEHPYVKSAKVFVTRDGLLKIECTPRYPLARVVPARGESYFVDSYGKIMPLSKGYRPKLPVVRGRVPQLNTEAESDLEDLTRVGEFFALVNKSPFLEVFIDQLVVTALMEYIVLPVMGTEKIELGEWERMEEKLWDLEDFYTEVIAQIGWGKYEKISLKYDGQVVATRKTTATP
jgi:cell division protein FtsQ